VWSLHVRIRKKLITSYEWYQNTKDFRKSYLRLGQLSEFDHIGKMIKLLVITLNGFYCTHIKLKILSTTPKTSLCFTSSKNYSDIVVDLNWKWKNSQKYDIWWRSFWKVCPNFFCLAKNVWKILKCGSAKIWSCRKFCEQRTLFSYIQL
jgi:hypothetical protein